MRSFRPNICMFVMAFFLCAGCTYGPVDIPVSTVYDIAPTGLLYGRTVVPLTFNHHPTQTAGKGNKGSLKQVSIYYLNVVWDDNSIGDVAGKNNIQTVHYADIETEKFLLGIWKRQIIHIYGE